MARQSTLNVSLTQTLDRYVREKVESGVYESPSEVVQEGLRMLRAVEADTEKFWSEVRSKVVVARKEIAEGKFVDGPQFMDELISVSPRQKSKKLER